MIKITFNAFSTLNIKLKAQGIKCGNKEMQIEPNTSASQLIESLKLKSDEVEALFINHKILPKETILKDGDRVALVPPGGIPNHVKVFVG